MASLKVKEPSGDIQWPIKVVIQNGHSDNIQCPAGYRSGSNPNILVNCVDGRVTQVGSPEAFCVPIPCPQTTITLNVIAVIWN